MTPGIRPLVAGNWKMNGTSASLTELHADRPRLHAWPRRRDGGVDLRSGDAALPGRRDPAPDAGQGRRPGLPRQGKRRAHRRHLRRDAEGCRRKPCHRRPLRAPHRPRRGRRDRARQGGSRVARRARCHHLHRRNARGTRERARRSTFCRGRSPVRVPHGSDGSEHGRRLRAGLGDRHRPDPDRRRRRRGACPHPRQRCAKSWAPRPTGCASSMAVRSSLPTRRELLSIDNVDGALVGGASLKAADFLGIAEAYRKIG